MKINSLNFFNINQNRSKVSQPLTKTQGLHSDVFEKTSNVSFKSNVEDNQTKDIEYEHDIVTLFMYMLNSNFSDSEFYYTPVADLINGCQRITNLVLNPEYKKFNFATRINTQLDDIGIKTVAQFATFMKNNYTKETIEQLGDELSKSLYVIYSLNDENKTKFQKFPSFFIHVYNTEKEKDTPNFDKLNQYLDFFQKININNEQELIAKFSYLKSDDADVINMEDIQSATDNLINNYNTQITILSDVLKANKFTSKNVEKTYLKSMDVIDYMYTTSPTNFEDELTSIIDYVAEGTIDSIKNDTKKSVPKGKNNKQNETLKVNLGIDNEKKYIESFNELKTPKDKLNFYYSLKNNGIKSLAEFKNLLKPVFISNLQPTNVVTNKSSIISTIQNILKDEKSSNDFYNKFKDSLNAINTVDGNLDKIIDFYTLTTEFKIKNDEEFLKFYNICNKKSFETLKSEELKNFIDLFEYNTFENITNESKKTKKSIVDLLKQEKTNFEAIEKAITDLIENDKYNYLLGKTPFEVYKTYKSLSKIEEVIRNNTRQNELYSEISRYLPSEEIAKKFILNNEIKINTGTHKTQAKIDKEYSDTCLQIVKLLNYDKQDKNYPNRISFYTNSYFLKDSKTQITGFLNKFPNENKKREVLNLIADKEIKSLTHLENEYLKPLNKDENSTEKLIENLKSLPEDIDFETYMSMLYNIQGMFNDYYIPLQINANNINHLDESLLRQSNLYHMQPHLFVPAINKMLNVKDGYNFFYTLPDATTDKVILYPTKNVATHILHTFERDTTSFVNILSRLNISPKELTTKLKKQGFASTTYYLISKLKKNPDLMSFINSNDWLKFDKNPDKVPNLTFHARLRVVDRFALAENPHIDLKDNELTDSLKDIFRRIYTTNPTNMTNRYNKQNKMVIYYEEKGKPQIKAVIVNTGQIITIVDTTLTKKEEIAQKQKHLE